MSSIEDTPDPLPPALLSEMTETLDQLLLSATDRLRERLLAPTGKINASALNDEQRAAHGLAWLATYVEVLRQMAIYGKLLENLDSQNELESLLLRLAVTEYISQIFGGIPMNQGEFFRLTDAGLSPDEIDGFKTAAIVNMLSLGSTAALRRKVCSLLRQWGPEHLTGQHQLDELTIQMRQEIRRFSLAEVTPHAHKWHLENAYIPIEVIQKMSELGIFGLTIPEEFGGLGLGKEAMCAVSEELSRAYIGVGSLGTRSEIAAELILCGGTPEQQAEWLPQIATGEILPTAVFTEPNTGSDLASLSTRAVFEDGKWRVYGNKTWITHPVRADLMTLLARTNPDEQGYRGLSMFLASKPRGTDQTPFPADGMEGGEIEVLGYRGMKEYEISFDGFEIAPENLLGQAEGQGFKQLMQTFESARIQTAARALGVTQSALDLGFLYAEERIQFGQPLVAFPRVADKLVSMAAELLAARLLTYHAARQKDSGERSDVEAGMAKLLGARVAWSAADNALQIHGGNGFALEYPISRVLCDARILNIFEGAAEIQAQVIARRLLEH